MKVAQPDQSETSGRPSDGPRSLTRIMAIFDLVAQSDRRMTLSELSSALDCPKSSLLVLLRPLTERGYLMREKDTYFLGPRIFQFAQTILTNHPFESVLRGVMSDLVSQTGETALFAVRDGDSVFIHRSWKARSPSATSPRRGLTGPCSVRLRGL